jgi:histone acetyltransferase
MAREAFLCRAEADGDLAFAYLRHGGDPSPATSLWLVGLKGVYGRQLPNMPREYIARLVFDPAHRSIAIVRRGGAVLGGITYRAFPPPASLGEVAFCAVMASEQVKGFGTRLMNHAKAAARDRDGLGALLTYADNNAVGYFAKQGFTKEISLPRERVSCLVCVWGGRECVR